MLNRHPRARPVMPALLLLERALRQPDGRGIDRLPPDVMRDALAHLDRMADSCSGAALLLQQLRIGNDTNFDEAGEASPPERTAGEARLTLFVQADLEWKAPSRAFALTESAASSLDLATQAA
ncbi:MAG: hypothetical protein ABI887_10175 [Burkholderiales bacterium]